MGVEFSIRVIQDEASRKVAVAVSCSDESAGFLYWMSACEYFMRVVAKRSPEDFDRAVELLVEGATDDYQQEILMRTSLVEKPE
jgi:hypothetical protein